MNKKKEYKDIKDLALNTFKSLKVILEVLDKGNKGLLLGDIHQKVIYGCGKVTINNFASFFFKFYVLYLGCAKNFRYLKLGVRGDKPWISYK